MVKASLASEHRLRKNKREENVRRRMAQSGKLDDGGLRRGLAGVTEAEFRFPVKPESFRLAPTDNCLKGQS